MPKLEQSFQFFQPQVRLLNVLPSRASRVRWEWIFMFILMQMVEILLHYADRTLKKCPDQGKIQVMEQHFQVRCSRGLFCIDFLKFLFRNSFAVKVTCVTAVPCWWMLMCWVWKWQVHKWLCSPFPANCGWKSCNCASYQLTQKLHWFCAVLARLHFVLCRMYCLAGSLTVATAFLRVFFFFFFPPGRGACHSRLLPLTPAHVSPSLQVFSPRVGHWPM